MNLGSQCLRNGGAEIHRDRPDRHAARLGILALAAHLGRERLAYLEVHALHLRADHAVDSAEVQFVASTEVELDLEGALKVNKLIDALEDSDDVQNIYTNMSLSDEVRAQLEEQE